MARERRAFVAIAGWLVSAATALDRPCDATRKKDTWRHGKAISPFHVQPTTGWVDGC